MYTAAQIFLYHCATLPTALTTRACVNLDIRRTSILCVVLRIVGELIPGGIRNAFRKRSFLLIRAMLQSSKQ